METQNRDIGIKKRLANWLYPQAVLIWLLISVGFPAIYYIIAINQQKRSTTVYAQEVSEKFQNVIIEAPARWKYQKDKYNQIISDDLLLRSGVATIHVLDETGRPIADYEHRTEQDNKWWNHSAPLGSAPIILNNRKIATVQIKLPQSDILKFTLGFFILSAIVGTSLVFLIYSIPINFVGKMEGQLQNLIKKIQSSQAESDRLRVIAQVSEQRFRALVQGVDAIVWEADAVNYQFMFVSQQAEEILGYPLEDWLTNADFHTKYIYPDDRLQVANHYLLATSEAKQQVVEYRAIAANGRMLWLRDLVQVVKNEAGTVRLLRGVMVDITKFKHAEEQLRHDAFHDVLTGLPNRALFMHRLGQVAELAKRNQDYLFAVLFLDLDRFKVVNDSLGHKVGDQLLIEISRRLEMCIRSCDTVARHGGDEFVILLEDIKNVSDATYVAERIQQELVLPLNLSGHQVFAATSIGIALSTTGYDQPENLLRDADTAMYHAKSLGRGSYQVFDTSMHTQAVAMLQMESDIRRAIERQEFRLYYQPIVSLSNGRITGFEALLRLWHPERGLVSPAEFLPIAEETGLIMSISEWVLREACYQMRLWQVQFPTNPPLTVSVNLSNKHFNQPGLVKQIKQTLQTTGLDAFSLKLEITESVIMENTKLATTMLLQLRALGVHICLDDFGTGYSSLSYLHRFPIDTLKIDRSFVSNMSVGDEENSKIQIIQTIILLAHKLDMDLIAEGVETKEQLAQLRLMKCKNAQGYFFSKPVNSKAVEALMAAQPQW